MATLHGLPAVNARRTPRKTALVFGEHSYTHGELNAAVNRHARALQSLGVKKGDRVAVLSSNGDRFLIAFYGGLKAGAIVPLFNPRSAGPEPHDLLRDSGAKVLMFSADTLHAVQALDKLEPVAVRKMPLDSAAPTPPATVVSRGHGRGDPRRLAAHRRPGGARRRRLHDHRRPAEGHDHLGRTPCVFGRSRERARGSRTCRTWPSSAAMTKPTGKAWSPWSCNACCVIRTGRAHAESRAMDYNGGPPHHDLFALGR